LGFISLAAVVFVYVYNAFIFAALALSVLMWAYKGGLKNALKQSVYFIMGSLLCLLTYQLLISMVYHSSLMEIYQHLIPFQNRMGLGLSLVDRIETYSLNLIFLFLTNMFRYNIIILFAFIFALPVFIKKIIDERNNFDIMILNLTAFLLLQSIIINDFPLRKLIILLPLVIIIITSSSLYFYRFYTQLHGSDNGTRFVNKTWLAAGAISLAVTALYLSPLCGDSASMLRNFMLLNLGIFLFINAYLFPHHYNKQRLTAVGIGFCLALSLIPNLYMDSQYVFGNCTYYFRDAMQSMSEKIDGRIVVGGCSYGFRLYNESIPILDVYMTKYSPDPDSKSLYDNNFERLFDEGIGSYSIAYTDGDFTAASGSYMIQHGMQLEEEYPLGEALGTSIGLYSPAPK
jgi:hypothetical protein